MRLCLNAHLSVFLPAPVMRQKLPQVVEGVRSVCNDPSAQVSWFGKGQCHQGTQRNPLPQDRAVVPREAPTIAQVVGDGSSPGRAGRVEWADHCALWGKCPTSLVLEPSPDAWCKSFCCALVISPRATKAAPRQRFWVLNRTVITTLFPGRCGGPFWSSSGSCSAPAPRAAGHGMWWGTSSPSSAGPQPHG